MTDKDIIQALEICNSNALIHSNKRCTGCKYNGTSEAALLCFEALEKDALDLIKRQKAEIEKLSNMTFADYIALKIYNLTERLKEIAK